MRRFFLCLACLAAFLVPWPGVWWRWPAAWLFLYASGIGARLGVVPLPRPLHHLVLVTALEAAAEWGNHARLYYGNRYYGRRKFDKEKWFNVVTRQTGVPALYFVVGGFAARFEQDDGRLFLRYCDQYDWDETEYSFLPMPLSLSKLVSVILPVENNGSVLVGRDENMTRMGRPFTTGGRFEVKHVSVDVLRFIGVPIYRYSNG